MDSGVLVLPTSPLGVITLTRGLILSKDRIIAAHNSSPRFGRSLAGHAARFFFLAAQRAFIASEIFLRAAAVIFLILSGACVSVVDWTVGA